MAVVIQQKVIATDQNGHTLTIGTKDGSTDGQSFEAVLAGGSSLDLTTDDLVALAAALPVITPDH